MRDKAAIVSNTVFDEFRLAELNGDHAHMYLINNLCAGYLQYPVQIFPTLGQLAGVWGLHRADGVGQQLCLVQLRSDRRAGILGYGSNFEYTWQL